MIRYLVRQYGVVRVTIGATLLSILLSIGIVAAANWILGDGISTDSILISILAPAIIAPLLGHNTFVMLAQLDAAERRLHALSTTDELTGAFNRRYFIDLALYELERTSRYGGSFSIAIMDFDNLKTINDRFGHLTGDQVLREVSRVCKGAIRETDIFARYGGDEFIFLLRETGLDDARECLQRIMEKIAALSFEKNGNVIEPRVSIGVHGYGAKSSTLDAMLEKADLALYKSKQAGGNKVSW